MMLPLPCRISGAFLMTKQIVNAGDHSNSDNEARVDVWVIEVRNGLLGRVVRIAGASTAQAGRALDAICAVHNCWFIY